MQKKKRLLSICFVFALLCALCLSAHAAVDVPDESKTGTIRVTMLYNNQPVSGGTLSVYRVGDIHEDDGNYTFVLAEKFAGSNVTWTEETLGEPEVAKALSEYAAKNSIAADKTGTIGGDGKAALDGLALGLYLVKQEQPAAGYQCAEPFLVTVPYLEKETYLYDVDTTPKVEPLKVAPTDPPSSDTQTTVVEAQPSTVPQTGTLPQTGQLNWPIPVLVVLGLIFFSFGWFLRFGRKDRNEK